MSLLSSAAAWLSPTKACSSNSSCQPASRICMCPVCRQLLYLDTRTRHMSQVPNTDTPPPALSSVNSHHNQATVLNGELSYSDRQGAWQVEQRCKHQEYVADVASSCNRYQSSLHALLLLLLQGARTGKQKAHNLDATQFLLGKVGRVCCRYVCHMLQSNI